MKLKKILLTGLASIVISMSGGHSLTAQLSNPTEKNNVIKQSYDVNRTELDQKTLEQILNSEHQIIIEEVYEEHSIDLRTGERIFIGFANAYSSGAGVVVNINENTVDILTCEHLKPKQRFQYQISLFGSNVRTYTPAWYKIYLVEKYEVDKLLGKLIFQDPIELKHVRNNPKADLMLLRTEELTPEQLEKFSYVYDDDFKIRIANEDELIPGNIVYTVGHPMGLGKQLTQGIISGLGNQNIPEDDDFIYVTTAINFGNSGGPNYVFKNGKPYLLGLSRYKFEGVEGIYGVVKPSLIYEFLNPQQEESKTKPKEDSKEKPETIIEEPEKF